MNRLRFAARLAGLVGLLLLHLPPHYLWKLAGRRSPWPSRFLGACARMCGVRLTIVGEPLRRDVLVVCNHQSWLDILILGGATGSAFVAMAELASVPLIGWMCRLNRTIFIRREDRRAIGAQIAAVRAGLAEGPVAIFAEGTVSDGTELLPFKPALLQVLDPAPPGVRVQPLFLDYGRVSSEIAWGNEDGGANARRLLGRRGTVAVTLHCLEPFDPAEVGDRKAIAAEARRRIVDAIATSGHKKAMPEFTRLELAALHAIFLETPELALQLERQLKEAVVTERENSGGGFFTTITVAEDAPTITSPSVLGHATQARIAGLDYPLGFVLFIKQGKLHMLEGFAWGAENTLGLDLAALHFEIYDDRVQRLE